VPDDKWAKYASTDSGGDKWAKYATTVDTPDPTKPDPTAAGLVREAGSKVATPYEMGQWFAPGLGGPRPNMPPDAKFTSQGRQDFIERQLPKVEPFIHDVRRNVAEAGGAMAGGEFFAGASKGLPWLMRLLASSSGAGAGMGVGALGTGAKPKEALEESALGTMFTGAAEGGTAALFKTIDKIAGSKLGQQILKSKVTELEEKHAAETAAQEAQHQKELTAHREKVQQVKDDYAKEIQAHSEKAKDVSARQSAVEAKQGAAVKHQEDLAGLLKENLTLADKKIGSELGKEFDAVNEAVQAKNPKVKVNDAEREARGHLYNPDSVASFNNIMENVSGKLKMSDFSVLRKTYSNLNDLLYGGGEMPADLYQAVKTVRDSLGKDLQAAANKVGLGGKYSKVMRDYGEYKDAWADTSSIAKGGSPIRRILDAEDPAFVIDQLKWKAGDRLIEQIGKYQKYGADKALAGRLKGFIEQVKGMPSTAGEIPAAPERPKLPKAPERETLQPFDREAVARAILADRIKKALMYGGAAAGGGYLYEKFGGKGATPVP